MLISSGAPSIRYCNDITIVNNLGEDTHTHPAVLHGLLVELDLDRVQAARVGEAVVLDRVISVVALVDRHCKSCFG